MQRLLATLLLFTFSAPLLLPLLSSQQEENNLPACCRRDGDHKCRMRAQAEAARLESARRRQVGLRTAFAVASGEHGQGRHGEREPRYPDNIHRSSPSPEPRSVHRLQHLGVGDEAVEQCRHRLAHRRRRRAQRAALERRLRVIFGGQHRAGGIGLAAQLGDERHPEVEARGYACASDEIAVVDDPLVNRGSAELAQQRIAIDEEMEFYKKDPNKAPAYVRRQQEENANSQVVQRRFIGEQENEIKRVNARFDDELVRLRQLWTTMTPAAR